MKQRMGMQNDNADFYSLFSDILSVVAYKLLNFIIFGPNNVSFSIGVISSSTRLC